MTDDEMKIEIGRMLIEGISEEGIKVVVDAWMKARSVNPDSLYASFVEIGLPPLDPDKTVEGSLVKDNTEYYCALCGNIYTKEWSDEEAMEETHTYWPGVDMEQCGIMCDDCWQKIRPDHQK